MKRLLIIPILILAGIGFLGLDNFVNASDPASKGPARNEPQAAAARQEAPLAEVQLDVDGMSCGGCVFTIQSALSKLDGIETDGVQVDVASGKAVVAYDPAKLGDTAVIARAITESGYEARITRARSADQVLQERLKADDRATTTIASVGGLDLSREDYETDLDHIQSRYRSIYGPDVFNDARGERLLNNLKGQVVRQMVTEGIQLREIQRAGFVVGRDKIERAYQDYLGQRDMTRGDFEKTLATSGFRIDYFQKKFANRVLIETYVEEKVIAGATSDAEKQQRYADWFNNARLMAEVVYYDRELAALEKNRASSGGCGSSCSAGK